MQNHIQKLLKFQKSILTNTYCLNYKFLQLDGKLVEPKVAVPRKTNPKLVMRTRKIFVGGLSATTSLEDIKNYFEQFSKVS